MTSSLLPAAPSHVAAHPEPACPGLRPEVVIVDDHAVFSDALAAVIARLPDFGEVHVARTSQEAEILISRLRPTLAVIDVRLDSEDGLTILESVGTWSPQTRCVMLSGHLRPDVIRRATRLGAVAALSKGVALSTLLDQLRQALLGSRDSIVDGATETDTTQPAEQAVQPGVAVPLRTGSGLTAREALVLQLLANGDDVSQVARRLGLSTHTVRDYVKNAREKLGVQSQLAAVISAIQAGEIQFPGP